MDEKLQLSNIMVIDDTPANLSLLEEMLSVHFSDIRLFTDGIFAIESAKSSPPNLILLDVMMPQINGYEVCRKLKIDKKLKNIPVIFISAKNQTFDKVKAFKVGGVDYITKPFQIEEVIARVETHLKLHFYRTELEEKNNSLKNALEELKEAQSQLIQSKTMSSLGTLTAGIAHEINNPVNAINSSGISLKRMMDKYQNLCTLYEQITIDNIDTQLESIKKYKTEINFDEIIEGINNLLNNIERGSKRTIDIIQSLKTFTHMDLLHKEFISINENIDSTLTLLNHKLKDKITIQKDYGDVPNIQCFPGKMNQVFMNLFSNSMDAINQRKDTGGIGKITVKTSVIEKSSNKFLEVTITDTGCGIPEEIKERVFEPFFTTKEVGKGTGLGLSISHGIIQNHSGSITVESSVGIGTTFIIQLPYNPENSLEGQNDNKIGC